MESGIETVTAEADRFIDFAHKILAFLVKRYTGEISIAIQDINNFVKDPFNHPELTEKALRDFEEDTKRSYQQLHILVNTLRSRIATFSSNYNTQQLSVDGVLPELTKEYDQLIGDIGTTKGKLIDHFTEKLVDLEKLKSIVGEELKIAETLKNHASLVEHLNQSGTLVHIFSDEQAQHKKIMNTFAFSDSALKSAIMNVKVHVDHMLVILQKNMKMISKDLSTQKKAGQLILALSTIVNLFRKIADLQGEALSQIHTGILNFAKKMGWVNADEFSRQTQLLVALQ